MLTVEPLLTFVSWSGRHVCGLHFSEGSVVCSSVARRPPMSKRELIDAIRRHNHSVAPEFLARFAESDLKAYLERVCVVTPTVPPPRVTTVDSKCELMVS